MSSVFTSIYSLNSSCEQLHTPTTMAEELLQLLRVKFWFQDDCSVEYILWQENIFVSDPCAGLRLFSNPHHTDRFCVIGMEIAQEKLMTCNPIWLFGIFFFKNDQSQNFKIAHL